MNSGGNLKRKIKEWLTKQGYPLEMRVATSFRKAGFDVIQSHYYIDPENDNYREIDIIATKPDFIGGIDISFIIECKSSKEKPWLLFSSDRVLENRSIFLSYCINSDSTREALIKKGFETINVLPWIKKEGRIAYGLTQAFTSGDDITYKATISVLKATISRKKELNKRNPYPFIFLFPVIIVDGQLFECFLNSRGLLSIQEFQEGFLYFPLHIAGECGTCIHILSSNKIEEFCEQAKGVSDSLFSLLEEDRDIWLKTLLPEK
ncbi:hypothetical protein KAW96_04915 [candidate division WOR-3 bacterium]|nr:hypothetical protein [candidate division WOR-3 bacterium]